MRVHLRGRLALTAAIGDFIVILLFPLLGAPSHAMGMVPDTFVRTVVPFAAAWALVGALAGAFAPTMLRSPPRTLRTIPTVWLGAGALGVVLRSLLFGRPLELSFALVSIGVIGVMLAAWRLGLAALRR